MLEKQFNPESSREHAKAAWPEEHFKPQGEGDPFCIMLPPPNVTGTLHMGHGFQHTLMDALIRYHRMCGDQTLWQPGTDHAGIATQIVVEKLLAKENSSRKAIGREAFQEKVWEWKEHSGNIITQQMKRMGASADWSRERFTMDDGLSNAVLKAFVQLYRDGLIYRGTRLVNWDPVLGTALSDLEVISAEEKGSMWHIRYPLVEPVDGIEYVVIATTRPETFFGDVAVAVNPTDERFQKLIGKRLRLPLTDRIIPIIADDYVDPAFGTGCVKITPAHDFNDFEIGVRHALEPINIFNKDATLNECVPKAYQGLTREAARTKALAEFSEQGLLEETKPHILMVPRSERSGAIVEPYLTQQWYVRMQGMAEDALSVVENGEVTFVPDNWRNTYRQWLTNIQDWCISRQLWWGHRIPAWYDEAGNIYVAESLEEAQTQAGSNVRLHQDEDVLDTWFSAALWPFSTLGWPEKTEALAKFFPTSVLVTGFDIIFFWVARMIMFGRYFTGQVPFKQVLFTGLIRDHEGQKMSKSKGNVLDPIDLIDGITLEDLLAKRLSGLMLESQKQGIEKATRKQFPDGIAAFGEDALRFTYCALATHGRDIRFDLGRMEGYRNFCNKLWNATRFIQMQMEKCSVENVPYGFPSVHDCALPERWLLSKLNDVVGACHKHFAEFRFDLLSQALYEFIWHDYCDQYIEKAKKRLNENAADQAIILQVLVNTLDTILRLLHPLMPFITEDLWQHMSKKTILFPEHIGEKPLMLQAYPREFIYDATEQKLLTEAFHLINESDDLVATIHALRHKLGIKPKEQLDEVYVYSIKEDSKEALAKFFGSAEAKALVKFSAKVEKLIEGNAPADAKTAQMDGAIFSVQMIWEPEIQPLTEEEKTRLRLKQEKLQQEEIKLNAQYANKDKMPEAVVAKMKNRMQEVTLELAEIQSALNH